jgi:acetyl-CoA carboxylase alpha subunit
MAEKKAIELLETKIQELRELNKMEEIDMSGEILLLRINSDTLECRGRKDIGRQNG